MQTNDAAGNVRKLVDVLGDVATATKNLPSGIRMTKFNEAFGLLGITAASAIGKQVANTRHLYDELLNIEGIASRTAKEMDSGIGGSFRILMSSIEGVAIAIGEALSGPLQQFSDAVSGTLSVVIQWIEANHELVQTVTLVVFNNHRSRSSARCNRNCSWSDRYRSGGIGTLMSVVAGAIAVVGSLLGSLLTPIGLTLTAIVALGAYLLYATEVGEAALTWLAAKFYSPQE